MSEVVTLDRNIDPRFPKNCVRCARPGPESELTITRRHETLFNAFGLLPLGTSRSFVVPACAPCASLLRRRYRIDSLTTLAAGCLAALLALTGHRLWAWPLTRTFVGVALVLTIAITTARRLMPAAFDITVEKSHVDFEFRDANHAAVFRTQNELFADTYT